MNLLTTSSEIIECLRIARLIERHGEQFINRVYTTDEIRFCQSRKQATQHFAAYWAGKEAVLRLLGTSWRRGINWLDIELQDALNNQTLVSLRGGVNDLMQERQIAEIRLSVAHCRTHAVAHALGLGYETVDEHE